MKLLTYRLIAWALTLLRVKGHNWNRRAGAVQAARTRAANRIPLREATFDGDPSIEQM